MITLLLIPYGTSLVDDFNSIMDWSQEKLLTTFRPYIHIKGESHKEVLAELCSQINADIIDTENNKLVLTDPNGCVNF